MGLGMKKHPDKTRPDPVIGWMNASTDRRRGQLQSLQDQVRAGAMKLAQDNTAKIASEVINLVQSIRGTRWPAAALICTVLIRLIQIQIEAEHLLFRYRNEGRINGRRR